METNPVLRSSQTRGTPQGQWKPAGERGAKGWVVWDPGAWGCEAMAPRAEEVARAKEQRLEIASEIKVGWRVSHLLRGPPQTLVALKRVQALQQRGPGAAPEAAQKPPEGVAGDQKGGVGYTDQDRKILQLCGEDLAGGAGPSLEGRSRGWAGPESGARPRAGPGERCELRSGAGRRGLGEALGPLSDPRPGAFAGELYDLDASSLQLKVLQYVSPGALPTASLPGPTSLSALRLSSDSDVLPLPLLHLLP